MVSQIQNHTGNWLKKLMGNCKHSPNIPPLQKLDSGEYVIKNEDKANILNNFFCSITEIENSYPRFL